MAESTPEYSGDRPLEKESEDRLGFVEPAKHLAKVISQFASADGFVIGIEGSWGSGKSSLVNLIIQSLENENPKPKIVRFSPWLIKSRDGLIEELFREIGNAAVAIAKGEGNAVLQEKIDKGIKGFAAGLSHIETVANLADTAGVPFAKIVGKAVGAGAKAADAWLKEPSLEKQKKTLSKELAKLTNKIVVVIDDLDRLEPAEAAEVVRLVRAVADFPNVIYLLCYDRKILSHSLKVALRLKDGSAYLDKILQVTFLVPKPEDFDLRRWYRTELKSIFPQAFDINRDNPSDTPQRLQSVIDLEGGRSLETPRSVVRAINAMRLYAGPVANQIDLADMVWLQFVRLRNPSLYEWIEKYLINMGAVAQGSHVSKEDARKGLDELQKIIELEGRDFNTVMYELRVLLPGINYLGSKPKGTPSWALYEAEDKATLVSYITGKRLGSPQHFRLYFALSVPSGTLSDDKFQIFLSKCATDTKAAGEIFKEMASTKRPQGGTIADALLDRLENKGFEQVPKKAIPALLLCFANYLDIAALNSGEGQFGEYWIWVSARRVFRLGIDKLSAESRKKVIQRIFSEGRAWGWLSDLMRSETFAHGRFGNQQKRKEEWILTEAEFDIATANIFPRFEKASVKKMFSHPSLMTILFFWNQGGGIKQSKQWVAKAIGSNSGLLKFLDKARSWSARNDKVYYPLRKTSIAAFVDYEAIKARVKKLAKQANKQIKEQANKIMTAFEQGEDRNGDF